jgi:integrase
VPAKVISERLGHANAAFTLQTYTHVTPGMDRAVAESVAALILAPQQTGDPTDVRDFVRER